MIDKPPYKVPTMREIAESPKSGYRVASTFSGTGGSCLGYRMAGMSVVWANEMEPNAVENYRANNPETVVDTRDIRRIFPDEILKATGLKAGELDLLDGSPPCQSFSSAGKRERGWGKVMAHGDGTTQVSDDLFFEFARLLKGLQPKVFVAENVSGLVKGKAKGYFKLILAALKAEGYVVAARVLDAQWLGVPQMRQRVIFVGVRADLVKKFGVKPEFPSPLPYRYSVAEAMPWVREIQLGDPKHKKKAGSNWERGKVIPGSSPCPTVKANSEGISGSSHTVAVVGESDISRFAIGDEWGKLKPGEQSKRYFSLVKADPKEPSPTITSSGGSLSLASVVHYAERRKFTIAELRRICSFPDDFILSGTYAQQWARLGNSVPPVMAAAIGKAIVEKILDRVRDGQDKQASAERADAKDSGRLAQAGDPPQGRAQKKRR